MTDYYLKIMITDYDPNTELIYYWNIVTDPATDIVASGPNQGNENRITDISGGKLPDVNTGEDLQTWLDTYGSEAGNDKEIPEESAPIFGLVLGFYGNLWVSNRAELTTWGLWNITDYDISGNTPTLLAGINFTINLLSTPAADEQKYGIIDNLNVADASKNVTIVNLPTFDDTGFVVSNPTGGSWSYSDLFVEGFLLELENGNLFDFLSFFTTNNICFSPYTRIPVVNENNKITYKFIQNLKRGDMIKTLHGNLPLSKLLRSKFRNKTLSFVKISKGCLGNNLPRENIYVTEAHPISLGYYKNAFLNNGIHDEEQDEYVFMQINAKELVGVVDGIEMEDTEYQTNYNLIFDIQTSFDVEGIEMVSHHPVGNNVFRNPRLKPSEFHDNSVSKKQDKPFYMNMHCLKLNKPKDLNLKDFIRKCIMNDKEEKFVFPKVNPEHNYIKDFKYPTK